MEENKRAAELLDEKQERAADAEVEKKQAISDPGEQLRKLCSGTMTLMHPFKAHDQEVQEIKFDFCGLTGSEIPIGVQVVSLADAYDALLSDRAYKSAYPAQRAMEMIRCGACGAFDPLLLECLTEVQDVLAEEVYREAPKQ